MGFSDRSGCARPRRSGEKSRDGAYDCGPRLRNSLLTRTPPPRAKNAGMPAASNGAGAGLLPPPPPPPPKFMQPKNGMQISPANAACALTSATASAMPKTATFLLIRNLPPLQADMRYPKLRLIAQSVSLVKLIGTGTTGTAEMHRR